MAKKEQEKPHPLAGCVLHESAMKKERFTYEYPNNGLPEVRVKSAPAEYAMRHLMKRKDK